MLSRCTKKFTDHVVEKKKIKKKNNNNQNYNKLLTIFREEATSSLVLGFADVSFHGGRKLENPEKNPWSKARNNFIHNPNNYGTELKSNLGQETEPH